MIRIVIVGAAGRMGKRLIANILEAADLQLAGAVEWEKSPDLGKDAGLNAGAREAGVAITANLEPLLEQADAIIDFSTGTVLRNAELAVKHHCAVVLGTTALNADDRDRLHTLGEQGGRLVVASNMSVGVNLLFNLVGKVAKILGEDYDIEIVEMHHNQKKDAPSGTAVTLAEKICAATGMSYDDDVTHGRQGLVGARPKRQIGMHALRGGDVVGDHTVIFATGGERVELSHKASSRDTFAKGALRAVRFLAAAKPGCYSMQDVLGLN